MVPIVFQIAMDEKEAILGNIPSELKERGTLLYTSLIDGKVLIKNGCFLMLMESSLHHFCLLLHCLFYIFGSILSNIIDFNS